MLLRLSGVVLGAAAAWSTAVQLPLGRGLALAGPVFAALLLLTALAAERFAPRPSPDGPRSASVRIRRIGDYVPPVPAWIAGIGTIGLVVLLWATTKAGSPDDQGRPGRAFTRSCWQHTSTITPWPGSYYSIPVLIASGVCLALTLVALHEVVRRPRLRPDDASRRRASEIIVAAYGMAIMTPLAGSLVIVSGVGSTAGCENFLPLWPWLGWVYSALVVVAVTTWIYLAKTLLWGTKRG